MDAPGRGGLKLAYPGYLGISRCRQSYFVGSIYTKEIVKYYKPGLYSLFLPENLLLICIQNATVGLQKVSTDLAVLVSSPHTPRVTVTQLDQRNLTRGCGTPFGLLQPDPWARCESLL